MICFCSWGDNITLPQQALDWILDLYEDVGEIVANGQTIIYAVHESIGHRGIFVSGQVAQMEHSEFVSVMDLIEVLPPGLYEAVIDDAGAVEGNRALIKGDYLFRLEARTVDTFASSASTSDLDNKRSRPPRASADQARPVSDFPAASRPRGGERNHRRFPARWWSGCLVDDFGRQTSRQLRSPAR